MENSRSPPINATNPLSEKLQFLSEWAVSINSTRLKRLILLFHRSKAFGSCNSVELVPISPSLSPLVIYPFIYEVYTFFSSSLQFYGLSNKIVPIFSCSQYYRTPLPPHPSSFISPRSHQSLSGALVSRPLPPLDKIFPS